jgi:hypothetical protein
MSTEEVRTIRFSLFEAEVDRLREFPGRLEKNILEAVELYVKDQGQARLMSITSNLYSNGNLRSLYIKLPATLAQQLDACTQRPEEAITFFLASYRPPIAAQRKDRT